MTENSTIPNIPMHYVCTLEQGKKLRESFQDFWVMNCGCRHVDGNECSRSRHDLCLVFYEDAIGGGTGKRAITKMELDEIFKEAEDKHLVLRPFKDYKTRTRVEGICFCCDCCCEYFKNPNEVCDKGTFIEITDMDSCTHCGECVEVCYFKARSMNNGEHEVDREKCYGCGLCVDVCPVKCIEMLER